MHVHDQSLSKKLSDVNVFMERGTSPSTGSSTPPRYSPGASTPQSYSLRTSRNAECSNCKHLLDKITKRINVSTNVFSAIQKRTIHTGGKKERRGDGCRIGEGASRDREKREDVLFGVDGFYGTRDSWGKRERREGGTGIDERRERERERERRLKGEGGGGRGEGWGEGEGGRDREERRGRRGAVG
ncbi:hypothetical protein Tco_0530983 [Tanacetum coccineum]